MKLSNIFFIKWIPSLFIVSFLIFGEKIELNAIELEVPNLVFAGQKLEVEIIPGKNVSEEKGFELFLTGQDKGVLILPDLPQKIYFDTPNISFGLIEIQLKQRGTNALIVSRNVSVIPAWISILPPLLAIIAALLWRSVFPALFMGVWCGAWLLSGPSWQNLGGALLDAFQGHIVSALIEESRVSIIMFTMMLGGMIGILSKNGGMEGVVHRLMKITTTPRRGQLVTSALGCVIFFDDIANTLLVGKTMRPVYDKLKLSREKLAYIIDSTAAPIASIAFATTWIGYEVSIIESSLKETPEIPHQAYSLFLSSVPYSFYSFLALFLVVCVSYSGRDFGPMLTAEKKARRAENIKENIQKEECIKQKGRARNAIIPIFILVLTLIGSLAYTGSGNNIHEILGTADSYKALMWSSFIGAISAAMITLSQGIMRLEGVIEAWLDGMQTTFAAMIILVLSWALADITQSLHTSDFLINFLGANLNAAFLPSISFILAGIIALTTGTSWGSMGIMMPLVLPLSWSMLSMDGGAGMENSPVLFASIAAVLAGASWGDHCSPISDTTILSSIASECDHIEHVRTQLPYAAFIGIVSVLFCTLPVGFGVPWWLCLIFSGSFVWFILIYFGSKSEINDIEEKPKKRSYSQV